MNVVIKPRRFSGDVFVPASKSHTIRRLLIAALASGTSILERPLESLDAESCLAVCTALGAKITRDGTGGGADGGGRWIVEGIGGAGGILRPTAPLDVGNSGTTLFLSLAAAALSAHPITFTGDEQIARRSAAPLLTALESLGVKTTSNGGCTPVTVEGPVKSGRCTLPCPTSQYLSALLLSAPLAHKGVIIEIDVPLLNEKPYIEMTLTYLDAQNIKYKASADFSYFKIEGGQSYKSTAAPVTGDFSSAAFPAAAAVLSGGCVVLRNLDPADSQGDKAFFSMLSEMGAAVEWEREGEGGGANSGAGYICKVSLPAGKKLSCGAFDLNATPDMLPAAAVLGAFACGETKLYNAAHARLKESDRIKCMREELSKLGVRVRELEDGLLISGTGGEPFKGGVELDGHGDHRLVMALSAAALAAASPVEISGAESAAVTYPHFFKTLGGGD